MYFLFLLFASHCFAYVDEGSAPLVKISAYKPIYIVTGKGGAKLQLSFKAKPAEALPLYLGYSQLMMWEIYNQSAPMRDINFDPEVFYRFSLKNKDQERWLDLGFFEHESNGSNGKSSRSWNRSYLRFTDTNTIGKEQTIQWSAKLWIPYGCEGGVCNQYRGIGEFNLSLENILGTSFGENDLILRFYPGGPSNINFLKGGQELTLRGRPNHKNYLPLLVVQLFHGYGENMLDQDQNRLALRGGFGF